MSDINVTVQDEIVNIDVIDEPVLVNVVNSPGQQGPAGPGVPVGGTAGQVLAKNSSTNYDTVWVNQSGGVPYSGATGNVNIGEYELKAGQVTLDTSPTGTAAVGTIRWNDTTGTSETTLKGGNVIIKNGVDLVARVVNKVTPNTTLTKAAYQAVRVSGAQGQRLAIELAQANNDAGSADTIGLVTETIATNQEGFIMTVGQLEGINTTGSLQGETWVDGDVLYLSPTIAGAITNVKPTGAGHIVVIGYVEYAHQNNGKIYVKVMNGWELEELHDVDIVTPANNEGLFYETSSALWKNKSISTVLGYTPEQPLTFNSPLSRAGNVVSIPQATGSVNGFLSATDWTTFNSKQAALGFTPANAATTLTINGVTFDLSANRSWTIAAGISGSGAAGQVTYWTGASAVSGSNNLFWDAANSRLGIGTNAPAYKLHVVDGTGFISWNQNLGTEFTVSNTLSGTLASAILTLTSNSGAGSGQLVKYNSSRNAYKIFAASDFGHYNGTAGDISFLNDWASGRIKFAAGASFTSQMTLFANGNLAINNGVSDLGVRFGVIGDTLLRGSGATSATTALTVQNSASTNLFSVRNDGLVTVSNALLQSAIVTSSATSTRLAINNTNANPNAGIQLQTNAVGNWSLANYIPGGGTNASFVFYNDRTNTDSFFINGDTNNVGINTNNPTARLDVRGDTLLRGSGSTIATTALTVQNSSSTNLLRVLNDGDVSFGADAFYWDAVTSRLGIGTNAPLVNLDIISTANAYLRVQRGNNVTNDAAFVTQPQGTLSASNVSWNYGLQANSNNFRFWYYNGTTTATALNITNTGNVHIGSGTDATVRLQVTGDTLLRGSGATSATTALTVQNSSSTNLFTVRNDGLATFGGNMILSFDQNATTNLRVRNLTNGSASAAEVILQSDTNSGSCSFSKTSTSVATYKILVAKDFQIYNGPTGGDIAFLNDFATGQIKFAAGASSTAHMTIKSNGRINMSSLPTSSTGLAAGDLWNDAGTVKIV